MPNDNNVFDNSGGFSPEFEGQVNPNGAGDIGTQGAPAHTHTDAGQAQAQQTPTQTQQTQTAQSQQPQQQGTTTATTQQPINYETEYLKLKQAYDNLRPAYTRATQELSRYKQQDNRPIDPAYAQQPTQPPVDNPYRDPQREQVVDLISGIVQQVVAPMQQQQAELVMQNEVAKFRAANPDFDAQAPKMYELLEQMPTLWQIGDVGTVLNTAYKLAKAEAMEQTLPNIVAQAQDAVYANLANKDAASIDRTRPANIAGQQQTPADAIKAGILADATKTQGSIF